MREDSMEYLMIGEGFKIIEKSLIQKAFQGLYGYSEVIKDFKYKHAYEYMKRIVTTWRTYTEMCKVKRTEFALLKEKCKLLNLHKALMGWKNYTRIKLNNKKEE